MVTSWRRAFCTTIPREDRETIINVSDNKQQILSPSPSKSPRSCGRLGFLSGSSNPTTPRLQTRAVSSPSLRCKTMASGSNAERLEPAEEESPNLHCKINTPRSNNKSPKPVLLGSKSNPASPRSPLKLSLFRNSFKFRSSCGICLNSVKTSSQGTAIYAAECGHAFHFPCISSHVRKHNNLVCPVCNATWKDVPLLSVHKNLQNDALDESINNSARDKNVLIVESNSPRLTQHEPLYDDDEPLLSPTTESENDIVETIEQFQCFNINAVNSRTVQVRLLAQSAVISTSRCFETYAVSVRVKAPPRNNTVSSFPRGPPIDLVTVLDVRGSMIGPKLEMLKRTMRLLVSSLGSADRLSLVAFSTTPVRLLPLVKMTARGRRAALLIVDRLVCGHGTTSFEDVMRKASTVLEDRRERNPVASIILLSDGHDGTTRQSNQRFRSSHEPYTRFARVEIPVLSSGFGKICGYSSDPTEDEFAKWICGLLNVAVQDLRIQLSIEAPAEILALYSCSVRPIVLPFGSVRLGNLYADEEGELLAELRIPSGSVEPKHELSIRCLYKDPKSQEVVYGSHKGFLITHPHAVRSTDPKIERLRSAFITTRAIAEARRLVECNGNYMTAHHLLASSRALLMQLSSGTNVEYIKELEDELVEINSMRQQQDMKLQDHVMIQRTGSSQREGKTVMDESGEECNTPSSVRRAAAKLVKVSSMKKSLNRVSDLHGFENARF